MPRFVLCPDRRRPQDRPDGALMDLNLEVNVYLHPHPRHVPRTPSTRSLVICTRYLPEGPPTMTGQFVLSALVPADQVTKRTVTYTVNGGPPVILDMTNPATTFTCNPGDVIS